MRKSWSPQDVTITNAWNICNIKWIVANSVRQGNTLKCSDLRFDLWIGILWPNYTSDCRMDCDYDWQLAITFQSIRAKQSPIDISHSHLSPYQTRDWDWDWIGFWPFKAKFTKLGIGFLSSDWLNSNSISIPISSLIQA